MRPENRRSMERCDFNLPVRLTAEMEESTQSNMELMTKNICAGGAFLETDEFLLPGSKVKMVITLPLNRFKSLNIQKTDITVSGEIIRNNGSGLACRFGENYEYTDIF